MAMLLGGGAGSELVSFDLGEHGYTRHGSHLVSHLLCPLIECHRQSVVCVLCIYVDWGVIPRTTHNSMRGLQDLNTAVPGREAGSGMSCGIHRWRAFLPRHGRRHQGLRPAGSLWSQDSD